MCHSTQTLSTTTLPAPSQATWSRVKTVAKVAGVAFAAIAAVALLGAAAAFLAPLGIPAAAALVAFCVGIVAAGSAGSAYAIGKCARGKLAEIERAAVGTVKAVGVGADIQLLMAEGDGTQLPQDHPFHRQEEACPQTTYLITPQSGHPKWEGRITRSVSQTHDVRITRNLSLERQFYLCITRAPKIGVQARGIPASAYFKAETVERPS